MAKQPGPETADSLESLLEELKATSDEANGIIAAARIAVIASASEDCPIDMDLHYSEERDAENNIRPVRTLLVNGYPLGRDLGWYIDRGERQGWRDSLLHYVKEVVFPLRYFPAVYHPMAEKIAAVGEPHFQNKETWKKIFEVALQKSEDN